jgi:hypothetical protein
VLDPHCFASAAVDHCRGASQMPLELPFGQGLSSLEIVEA